MANILGINLSDFSEQESLKKIEEYLNDSQTHYATTPNPEIILEAQKDKELKAIINNADLSFADGFGLVISGFLKKLKINRITGADISLEILKLATKLQKRVLIVNWNKGLSNKDDIIKALLNKFPDLNFKIIDTEKSIQLNDEFIREAQNFQPQILFCTFGCPYQEKFIYNNLKTWNSLRFAIGVGGTFDFVTGKAKRAPKLIRKIGLEWLWRLVQQPKRLKRIFNATIIFLYKFLVKVQRN